MKDNYEFKEFNIRHGYMGDPTLKLSKKAVWEVIKNDKDFWKMKLYKIKVEQISHQSTSLMGGYAWPGHKTYITGQHWAKNLTEAKKIGEVIEQIHPKRRP